jgi:peptidyl-tRNA hydrolase
VTVNIGDIPQLKELAEMQSSQSLLVESKKPMQKLLQAAKENGGKLSMAQAAFSTELDPEEVQNLLLEATKFGYAEINNDPKTGAIRYHFDV